MPATNKGTNSDYTNPRGRRASLPGNFSLKSIPRLTRKISCSLASTSGQAFDWLNNHTKVQTKSNTKKCNDIQRSRPRGYTEISSRPAQFTFIPSNPQLLGKDIYGFRLLKAPENDKSKTCGRMVFDKIFPPLSDQPRTSRSSSHLRSDSIRTLRPISRSGLGSENRLAMRESIGQFDYPVRCDPIESNLVESRYSRIQHIPVRPRRPSEEVDIDLARLQRETYGIKTTVRRPVRLTKTVDREIASMQRESYGPKSIRKTQGGNEDLDDLSYVGLTMSVNKDGNIISRTNSARHPYAGR